MAGEGESPDRRPDHIMVPEPLFAYVRSDPVRRGRMFEYPRRTAQEQGPHAEGNLVYARR